MDDRAAINDQVGARFAKLRDIMTTLDADMSSARTSLALALHDMLDNGKGDPSAAEAMDYALSVAISEYEFAMNEALGKFGVAVKELK